MTFTATETRKFAYPCDICHEEVVAGEKVHVTNNGNVVEHADCASAWFRNNFGREGLA